MAINEKLNIKIRKALVDVPNVEEIRMFRGIAFMVNGKMCVTAGNDSYMFRVDPQIHDTLLQHDGCSTLIMKGRPYKGYVNVREGSIKDQKQLKFWICLALEFNQKLVEGNKKQQ